MKKFFVICIAFAIACSVLLCSCEDNRTCELQSSSGDIVEVSVGAFSGTVGRYAISHDEDTFVLTKGGRELVYGTLSTEEDWNDCRDIVSSSDIAVIENDSNRITWKAPTGEYESMVKVSDGVYVSMSGVAFDTVTEEDVLNAMGKPNFTIL